MNQLTTFLPIILMFIVFYFILIRPQQKKQRERNSMLQALGKGDQIVTIGGMHGTIVELKEDSVDVRVAHNVILTFDRSSISNVKKSMAAKPAVEPAQS